MMNQEHYPTDDSILTRIIPEIDIWPAAQVMVKRYATSPQSGRRGCEASRPRDQALLGGAC
jgi:hypothetical protein